MSLGNMATLLEKHLRESASTSMSDSVTNIVRSVKRTPSGFTTTESVFRSIEKEVRYIDQKRGQSVARGVVGASVDAEKLVQCYRRIESFFRLLQVNGFCISF